MIVKKSNLLTKVRDNEIRSQYNVKMKVIDLFPAGRILNSVTFY